MCWEPAASPCRVEGHWGILPPCEHQQWLPMALHCGRAFPEPRSPKMSPFPSPPQPVHHVRSFPAAFRGSRRLPEELIVHCTLTFTLVTACTVTCSSTTIPPALEWCPGPQQQLPVPSACPGQCPGQSQGVRLGHGSSCLHGLV